MKRPLLVGLLALTAVAPASAQGPERESLAGLRGVNVVVFVQCPQEQFKRMVAGDVLRSKIEVKLRSAGIKVYEDVASNKDPRVAALLLTVNAVSTGEADAQGDPAAYAIAMRLSLSQALWVVTNGVPVRAVLGNTWAEENVLCQGRNVLQNGSVAKSVEDWTDMFVNDWLATHSK
jgi:hypothetical protein